MTPILSIALAAAFMAALGLALAAILVLANKRLAVFEDPRIDQVEDLLPHCQFLSIHCPATPETHHLLNAERIALLRTIYLEPALDFLRLPGDDGFSILFDEQTIRDRCNELKSAITYGHCKIRYACKALTLQAILRIVLGRKRS